jgi:AcrR family transcriptional regulator
VKAAAAHHRPASDVETRDRLLQVATTLFAERGLKKVTVREICRAASANVAAVNYHFGDKLGLYREVLRSAIDVMRATLDAARRAGDGQPADERLRRFVRVYMKRVLLEGDHSVIHKLVTRELSDPTAAFDDLVDHGMRPRIDYLSTLVMDLLHCERRDPRVLRAVASVQAQTLFYFPNPVSARLGMKQRLTADDVDAIAEHITAFSLAGIRALAGDHRRSVPSHPRALPSSS